ncbi:MAG: hypothetical protein IPL13_17425 [Saprospiraceae bacterium]|nr:hypothetical protein [Candidatus Brachybacter algidus]
MTYLISGSIKLQFPSRSRQLFQWNLDNRTANKENALTRNRSANLNYEIKTGVHLGSKLSANVSF